MGRGLGVNCMHSVISCGFLEIVASILLDLLVEVGFRKLSCCVEERVIRYLEWWVRHCLAALLPIWPICRLLHYLESLCDCEDSFPKMTLETLRKLGFLGNPETRISSCSWNNLGTFWKFSFSDSLETRNPSHSCMTSEPFGNPVSLISQIPRKLGIPNTKTNSISILNNPTLDLLFLIIF